MIFAIVHQFLLSSMYKSCTSTDDSKKAEALNVLLRPLKAMIASSYLPAHSIGDKNYCNTSKNTHFVRFEDSRTSDIRHRALAVDIFRLSPRPSISSSSLSFAETAPRTPPLGILPPDLRRWEEGGTVTGTRSVRGEVQQSMFMDG